MLHALALATLLQATSFIPLQGPDADDGASVLAIHPNGQTFLVAHARTRSLTRYDVATGAVNGRVDFGPDTQGSSPWAIEWIPGTQEALVLDGASLELYRVDVPSLTVLGGTDVSVALSPSTPIPVMVDSSGMRAVVVGWPAAGASVIDIATMTEVGNVSPQGLREIHGLSPDGSRMLATVQAASPATGTRLVAIDIGSGLEVARANFGPNPSSIATVVQSEDRSKLMVEVSRLGLSPTEWFRLDAQDLSQTNAVDFSAFGVNPMDPQFDGSTTRAWANFGGSVFGFPVDGSSIAPTSPSVIAYDNTNVIRFIVSLDGTRLLVSDLRERPEAFDGQGLSLGRLDGRLTRWDWSKSSNQSIHYGFQRGAGAIFAGLRSPNSDLMTIVDLSPSTQSMAVQSVNTGFGEEFDGPFAMELIPMRSSIAVASQGSKKLRVYNSASGRLRGEVPTAENSTDMELRADGAILLGHQAGTLQVIDSDTVTVLARIDLEGAIEGIYPEPTGTRAWVRMGGTPADPFLARLLLVETEGPGAGELARIPLAGTGYSGPSYPGPNGGIYGYVRVGFDYTHNNRSIAFDFQRDRAYAVSGAAGPIETIDLNAQAVVASTPGGYGPFRRSIEVSPDGSHLLVMEDNGPRLWRTAPGGLQSVTSAACSPLGHARGLGFSADGATAFMSQWVFGQPSCSEIVAIDVASGTVLDSLPLLEPYTEITVRGNHLVQTGSIPRLQIDSADTRLAHFDGTSFDTPEQIIEGGWHARFDPASGSLIVVNVHDAKTGLTVVDLFSTRTLSACTGGVPNATGVQATLDPGLSPFAGEVMQLTVNGLLPGGMFGILAVSDVLTPPMPASSGVGRFCVGGALLRVSTPLVPANAAGSRVYSLDTASLPTSAGTITIDPGTSWTFQEWHRDQTSTGAPTSNTSEALQVTFR